jgi:hypothetical protein
LNSDEIKAGCSYRGCNGAIYHVERVERGTVTFTVDRGMVRVSIDLDTFAGLMTHELKGRGS